MLGSGWGICTHVGLRASTVKLLFLKGGWAAGGGAAGGSSSACPRKQDRTPNQPLEDVAFQAACCCHALRVFKLEFTKLQGIHTLTSAKTLSLNPEDHKP